MTEARDRLSRLRTKLVTRIVAGIGGFAAVALSLGMTVYDARTKPPPQVAAGQAIEAGQWKIEISGVEAGTSLPDGRRAAAGRGAVILTAKLTNRTGASSSDYAQAIELETAVQGIDDRPTTYLLRDKSYLRQLQPLLTERVAYVWTYPLASTLPPKLQFNLVSRKFKARDNLYAASGWFNPSVVGEIELPLIAGVTPASQAVQ